MFYYTTNKSNRYAVYPDLQTCEDNCPPVPVGPPTASCHPQRWENYQTWVSTWTSNAAFTPPLGINMPCQHICNRIQAWQANLAGLVANPLWENQLLM